MRRTSQRLLGLALGGGLVLGLPAAAQAAPASAASDTAETAVVAQESATGQHASTGAVQDPTPPPGPDLNSDSSGGGKPNSRQVAIGLGGVALIALVLLSRRMRKKPVLFVKWKK